MQLCHLAEHDRLQHRHRNRAGDRHGIAGAGRHGEAQDVRVRFPRVARRSRQLPQGDPHGGGCGSNERLHERLAAIVGRLEAVVRLGEVDGNEIQGALARDLAKSDL